MLYEYPPKLTRQARQQKALHDLEEHRKMRRTMYKNLILGGIIIVIGIIAPNVIVKMILILLGLANIAVGGLLYWYFAYYRAADVYTRILMTTLSTHRERGSRAIIWRSAFSMTRLGNRGKQTRGLWFLSSPR